MKLFKIAFVKLFYLLIFFLIPCKSFTTTISGSELSWKCIGHDSFIVTLTSYLDCNGPLGATPYLDIKCSSTGTPLGMMTFTSTSIIDITPVCKGSCTKCQSIGCSFAYGINKYEYSGLLVLTIAGSCCDILISYVTCCRSFQITTGSYGQNFYTEAMLNRCLSPCDNSPEFANHGISIICTGLDFVYNQGTNDPDTNSSGVKLDSFYYEWAQPLQIRGTPVTWSSGYNYKMPVYFWGYPNTTLPFPRGYHLDSITGTVSFRPMKIEVTIMTVKVSEFRNKVKIGELRREMEVIVINCPNNHVPLLSPAIYYKETCPGSPVTFIINSDDVDPYDTLSISYTNGITGASWTDNNGTTNHPTGSFFWTPNTSQVSSLPYTFTVMVNDNACPKSAQYSHAFQVLVKPDPNAYITIADSCNGNFFMNAHAITGTTPVFTWDRNSLPDNFKYIGATIHHRFSTPGIYPFTLKYEAQSCTKFYYDTVTVDSFLIASLPKDTQVCAGSILNIKGKYSGVKGKVKMSWNTSPTDTTNQVSVKADTNVLLIFTVSDTGKCIVKDSMLISAFKIIIKLDSLPVLCENDPPLHLDSFVTVNGKRMPGAGKWSCSGNGLISADHFDPKVSGHGTFRVKFEFTDSLTGCYNSDSSNITVNSSPHAMFGATPTSGGLPLNVHFKDSSSISSGSILYFLWDFGNGDTSTNQNSNYTYTSAGNYTVRLLVLSDHGCTDTISKINYIKIIPVSIADHNIFESISIKPNPAFDYTIISVNGNNTKIESVSLTNSLGKIILNYNRLSEKEIRIDRQGIEKGIYFLKIKLSDNMIINTKILFY